MRKEFITALIAHAHQDPSVYFVVGDVGFSFVEPFQNAFPKRFINAGVAEQNMIGMAAGLAMAGKKVYVYSIIPFVIMRCFEQIRVDLCYQNLPITLVGVGGGFGYGELGGTHHAIEDVGIMRALPGMTVVAPANGVELSALFPQLHTLAGPSYLRIAKSDTEVLYPANPSITLNKIHELHAPQDVLILTSGHVLDVGYATMCELKKYGIEAGIASVHTIKPLDSDYLVNAMKRVKGIIVIEEHNVRTGLSEAVAHTIATNAPYNGFFISYAINDEYPHISGSAAFLRKHVGISSERIVSEIVEKMHVFTNTSPISKYAGAE
jgi:transketolase